MRKINVPKYQPSQYKTKFDAVADMLKGGETVKQIKERMLVSDSYIYLAKKKLREAAGEVANTVRQTAAEHNDKVKEIVEGWRAEVEAEAVLGMPCTRECLPKPEVDDVDDILNERAATYGSFISVSLFAQEMKELIRSALDEQNAGLQADHQEALDMISSKIARIITGDSQHIDSWIDIAGYATLVADRLQGKSR
jgi:transposase-like protein